MKVFVNTEFLDSDRLDLVRNEVDQALVSAREAVYSFNADSDHVTSLSVYAGHLHQVVGTLEISELDGVARLAKEAELLAESMADWESDRDFKDAMALLQSSLDDVSASLGELHHEPGGALARNLEKINALRAARGVPPLEIKTIFDPDLEIYPPMVPPGDNIDEASYRARVAQIRKHYQACLLGWLRDTDHAALANITSLTAELQDLACFSSVAQLWWVATAYIEMMSLNPEQQNVKLHRHVPARLDQLMRMLAKEGEDALVSNREQGLVREMLYDIGCSPARSDLLAEVRRAFDLERVLREGAGNERRQSHAADVVSPEINAPHTDTEFHRGESVPDELPDLVDDSVVETPSEPNRLSPMVANEIYVNLDAVSAALESFANQPSQSRFLRDTPARLTRVEAILNEVDQIQTASLLTMVRHAMHRIEVGAVEGSQPVLEALLASISAVQRFVDGLEHDRPVVQENVDRSARLLLGTLAAPDICGKDKAYQIFALRLYLNSWLGNPNSLSDYTNLHKLLTVVSTDPEYQGRFQPRRIAKEMCNLLEMAHEDPLFLTVNIEQTLRRSLSDLEVAIGPVNDASTITTNEADTQAEDMASDGSGFTLDDHKIREFSRAALSNLAALREFIGGGQGVVTPDLQQAVDDLCASSRVLHLVEMSNCFNILGKQLSAFKSVARELRGKETETLDKAAILSAQVLDRLNTDRTFPAALRDEFDKLHNVVSSWAVSPRARSTPAGPSVQDIQSLGRLDVLDDVIVPVETATETDPVFSREDAQTVADYSDLRKVFVDETADVLSRINRTLIAWQDGGPQSRAFAHIKRDLHTLKGSAYAAGFNVIGDLGHQTETLLEKESHSLAMPQEELHALLVEAHDTLSAMTDNVRKGQQLSEQTHLRNKLRELIDALPGEPGSDFVPSVDIESADADAATKEDYGEYLQDTTAEIEPSSAMSRIDTELLDKLVNYAGELSVTRAQMQEHLRGIRTSLGELRHKVTRISGQLRLLDLEADSHIGARVRNPVLDESVDESTLGEFDPLQMDRYTELQELSRNLSENLDDLITIQARISQYIHKSESVVRQQAQLGFELQDGLMSTHLVPFATLLPKLRHQVRQTARELNKEAELKVVGAEVEIDRKVLDGISEALDHLIRNALDHGIEAPGRRRELEKPDTGTIHVECRQKGNEMVIRFGDDGAGLDVGRIREQAVAQELINPDAEFSDQELIQLIALPGFTTAQTITHTSGRGVGMDVVQNSVTRLGGSITIENLPGQGSVFELSLPLSLSITQAIFVRCGREEFAIPLNVIQQVMKVEADQLDWTVGRHQARLETQGQTYTLIDLSRRMGLGSSIEQKKRVPVLLVRSGTKEVAIVVSELLGTQEVVVKSLGIHVSGVEEVAGATIRGDGSVVLILNMAALLAVDERQGLAEITAPQRARTLVMVVDDSLTVRKVTARNLSRNGIDVAMAKDGIDAMEQMMTTLPDLMLIDIEMPRMDGYELTKRIRSHPEHKDIPILIITSRAGIKHREKAMALGANGYLTKPYQEEELIANVEACLSSLRSEAVEI